MSDLLRAAEAALALGRERLIAACRALIATTTLAALWVDPGASAQLAELARALAIGYAVFAVALAIALLLPRRRPLARRLPMVLHLLDLAVFGLLAMVTAEAASPFVLAFVFVVAAAALRWQLAGAVWTTVAALVLIGVLSALPPWAAPIPPTQALLRAATLVAITLLVGYLGTADLRLRARIETLAAWPPLASNDAAAELPRMLGYVAGALDARCLLLVWEDPEEPLCNFVQWRPDGFEWRHEEPHAVQPAAPPQLEGRAFAVASAGARYRLIVDGTDRISRADPLPAWLRARGADGAAVSIPLRGDSLSGRLYATGLARIDPEILAQAILLTERLAASLDQLELFEQLHHDGLARERARLAGDLHDGVIQSLAAAQVRLGAASQLLHERPLEASLQIDQVQELLHAEQRELRGFLGVLEPASVSATAEPTAAGEADFSTRLAQLVARVQRHWDIDVDLVDRLSQHTLARGLDHQVSCLVLEALVNASRHGRASRARVELGLDGQQIHVRVSDNGRGFGFAGRREHAELTAGTMGPGSIKRRVVALGGRLVLDSAADGATIDIRLPHRPLESLT